MNSMTAPAVTALPTTAFEGMQVLVFKLLLPLGIDSGSQNPGPQRCPPEPAV